MPPVFTLATAPDELFPDLDLGDARRNRRFARVVAAVAANPGASLPQLFPDPSAYHAALRVFDADACTHANILAAHQVAVLDALEARTDPILLLHDATLLDFSGHTTLAGDLGPIGNGGGTGWIAHQSLAVDPANRAVLGLVGQILHVRERIPKGEGVAARRDRVSRESRLWERGIDEIGPTPAGCQWVDVCDRGPTCSSSSTPWSAGTGGSWSGRRTTGGWGPDRRGRRRPSGCTTGCAAGRPRPGGIWRCRPERGWPPGRPGCRPRPRRSPSAPRTSAGGTTPRPRWW
ncbi:MAG TPA: transposase DNA-binding-containing protein [Urbifossiella sp.]|nr:transposase DNA-binding-containing protein [Urbifossiella sp.]